MFEKLFSKLRIGINMSSSPVDPTADKKQTTSSSKAPEVGKYLYEIEKHFPNLLETALLHQIFVF